MWMMPSSANNSAINGNHASGSAKVNNIIQTIHNNIINIPGADPAIARIIEQFVKESAQRQISQIFPELGRYLIGEYRDRPTSTHERAHRHHGAKVSYCFVRNAAFPELDAFDRNISEYLARYPDTRKTRCVIDILKRPQGDILFSWMKTHKINLLLLDLWPGSKERLEWTTNFTLEVIGRINWSNYTERPATPSRVIAHFCSAYASHGKQWQEYAIRDLLAQLRRAARENLGVNHDCKVPGQDDKIFHVEAKESSTLWALLLHSVAKAGIKLLYIIFDNFDSLQGRVNDKILAEFRRNILTFVNTSKERGVRVKLLVTSRSTNTADYFSGYSKISLTQHLEERFKS